jgi:GTPase SAR1 family protein
MNEDLEEIFFKSMNLLLRKNRFCVHLLNLIVVLIGDSSVGKSNLVRRFATGGFSEVRASV